MILAKDVMTKDVTTIGEDVSVKRMIQVIRKTNFSGLPVVDRFGKAVGLVSQNDILHALAWALESEKLTKAFHAGKRRVAVKLLKSKGKVGVGKLLDKPVRELMTAGVVSCVMDTPVAEICETMISKRIHRLVVLDDEGRVLGLIAATDLVRRFGEHLRSERALMDS